MDFRKTNRVLGVVLLLFLAGLVSISFVFISKKVPDPVNKTHSNNACLVMNKYNLPDVVFETSGLLFYNNMVWTFNDSGGEPELFGFALPDTSVSIRATLWNAYNFDWEDITQDNNYIYIGDIGNNFGNRQNLCIYRIKKESINKKHNVIVKGDKIYFTYPNYKAASFFSFVKSSYDCEAMVFSNDSIYLFSKDWISFKTIVYSVPIKPGKYIAHKLFEFNCNGLITAADYNGELLVLLGYKDFKAFLWKFKSLNEFISGKDKGTRIELNTLADAQSEGIALVNDTTILISAEGGRTSARLWELRMTEN